MCKMKDVEMKARRDTCIAFSLRHRNAFAKV
jgi:hypothetical protein